MLQARIDPTRARCYRQNLRRWFHAHDHNLPWRRTRDPHRILISEFMLYQTQVSRVTQVYEEFLDRFPIILQVADALLRDVKAVTLLWLQGARQLAQAYRLRHCLIPRRPSPLYQRRTHGSAGRWALHRRRHHYLCL